MAILQWWPATAAWWILLYYASATLLLSACDAYLDQETHPLQVEVESYKLHEPEQRVRREIRSISSNERDRVFAALNLMKQVPTVQGRAQFGENFVSYDDLVAKHMRASTFPGCDQAHLGPAFALFHRMFIVLFENSLLAVDPIISALPYWDYNIEAELEDPRSSEIWEWFGSSEGDPEDQFNVNDGMFVNWTVASGEDALEALRGAGDGSSVEELVNPSGLLRAAWNRNPSNKITRRSTSCGSETVFKTDVWDLCLSMPSYLTWYACIEGTVHTWAHSFVGGLWGPERNLGRIPCYAKYAVAVPLAWGKGCLKCPRECSRIKGCTCTIPWWPLKCFLVGFSLDPRQFFAARAYPQATYGDFADVWSSPNDPIFFFHHANVDRHLMTWQRRRVSDAEARSSDYSFPKIRIPCKGHGLDETLAASTPFEGSLLGLNDQSFLTNRDALHVDGRSGTPYTYDTVL